MAVRRDGNALVVRLDGLAAGARPPLVVLVAVDEPTQHRMQEAVREAPGLHVARFERVGAGNYLVVVEPAAGQ